MTDKIGGPFTPVGFYYRTMIRPRRAWPLYEKFLRSVAGLGRLDKHRGREQRYDVEHRRAEVLVIGGGAAGREAARARTPPQGAAGRRSSTRPTRRRPTPARASRSVTRHRARRLRGRARPGGRRHHPLRYRAGHIVVAAGAVEQPLIFPGNDLVGVVLPEAFAGSSAAGRSSPAGAPS